MTRRRQPFRLLALLLGAALCMLAAQMPASAGVFSVTPVRIYMTPKDRAIAVTLTNEGDSPLVLQAELYIWEQNPDGTDKLTPTEDLLLSPPIVKLGPKGRQVVRLAMLAPRDPLRQMTYRMILREVPQGPPPKESIQVPIALALNMPVFVTPPQARREVSCTIERADPRTLQATCGNTGTAYAQIREMTLKSSDGRVLATFEGGTYILPGARRAITLLKKTQETEHGGQATLSVTFDDFQSQTSMVTLP